MKKMMKRYLLLLLSLFPVSQVASAQEAAVENLMSLQLPPLDSLFEGAKKSSMVEYYAHVMEGEELNLKTVKRRWLEYFAISASYQYGVMGISSFTDLGSNFPIVYQSSGGNQLWYNVGASVRIPLDMILDRRNTIKRQQLKIQETLSQRDLWYDEQRTKIIALYSRAMEMIGVLKTVVEQATLSNAQFAIAEKDYIMGKTNAQDLNNAKGMQVQSLMQLERAKAELNSSVLQLEILSNTKIINK